MEMTGTVKVDVDAKMLFNQTFVLRQNTVCISLFHRFQTVSVDESDGTTVACTGFHAAPPLPVSQICLSLSSHEFSPNHLFHLIDSRLHNPPLSQIIAAKMANKAIQNVDFLQPYFMSVFVVLTQEVFSTNPEEETQQQEEQEETCAICLEDLSNNEPFLLHCSHQFHMVCIGEWLEKRNSCPLCREVVIEERDENGF